MKFIWLAFFFSLSFFAEAGSLTVMQYNAENLFDNSYDDGTQDYTYLPLSIKKNLNGHKEYCETMTSEFRKNQCLHLDWTEAKLTKKVINIAKVVKAFDKTGKGPDILVLQEVENKNALNKLVTKGLKGMGYQYQVLIEGDDTRGIDVAIVSRHRLISARHHSLFINGERMDTRGILEAHFSVNGNQVVVFANHWPSQGNPTSERIESARLLSRIARQNNADLILAMGDFNTLNHESPHPFYYLNSFIDSEARAREVNRHLNPGTHYYKGEWSSLDKIFIHEYSSLKPDYTSYNILTPSFIMKRDEMTGDLVPHRFNHETGEGYSDHLPVTLTINY